jgi:hypothetical protein
MTSPAATGVGEETGEDPEPPLQAMSGIETPATSNRVLTLFMLSPCFVITQNAGRIYFSTTANT